MYILCTKNIVCHFLFSDIILSEVDTSSCDEDSKWKE